MAQIAMSLQRLVAQISVTLFPERRRWHELQGALADLRQGGVVLSGPFTLGCSRRRAVMGPHGPLLAGSYEAELHDVLEDVIVERPSRIIDVGCAEGYYAVGLAMRCPDAAVFTSSTGREGAATMPGDGRVEWRRGPSSH